MKIRKPVVAGVFYPGRKEELKKQIEECFLHKIGVGELPQKEEKKRNILGVVSPHAGYIYSGPVASWGFYQLAKEKTPDVVVIIGPNHRGIGKDVAVYTSGYWSTPLGEIKVNEEIAEELLSKSKILEQDERAHMMEHSLEVQIPFLQYIYGNNFSFLPITLLDQSLKTAKILGYELSEVLKDKEALIIASSDFTHYESQKEAEYKDKKAIEFILKMEPEMFYNTVENLDISICGPGAIATMLHTCKNLNAKNAELLKYATSGDITRDYSQVVGYAAIKITR